MNDTPFGFCVVPESAVFKATGTQFAEPGWDTWAAAVMRTRLILVGTPVAPDPCGAVYLAFALCQLPTEESGQAVPMTPALPLELNLN